MKKDRWARLQDRAAALENINSNAIHTSIMEFLGQVTRDFPSDAKDAEGLAVHRMASGLRDALKDSTIFGPIEAPPMGDLDFADIDLKPLDREIKIDRSKDDALSDLLKDDGFCPVCGRK